MHHDISPGHEGPATGRLVGAPATKRAVACAIISDWLQGGRRALEVEVWAAVKAAGIGRRTYEHARRDLRVRWTRRGFQGPIYLCLPTEGARRRPKALDPADFFHGEWAVATIRAREAYRNKPLGGAR